MSSESATESGAAQRDRRAGLRFDEFSTRVLYVVAFGLAALSPAQSDLWWLLRAGKDIWHTGRVELVERYSHTADGRYWSNHEWLWEATAFALHRVGSMPLLSFAVCATAVATLWAARRVSPARGYVVPVVLACAVPLLGVAWTARPQVTSLLFLAVTMLLLSRERYWWIPPLFLLWANVHAQVVMGGVILVVTWATAVLAHVSARSALSRTRALRLTLALGLSAVATLCTPLGVRLWSYVLGANGRPGQERIAEWATAFHPLISNLMFWAILALAIAMAVRRRDRLASWDARVPLVATLAMAPLAILAVRNIPFFTVAALPVLMTLLEFRTRGPIGFVIRWRVALAVVGGVTAALVALVWAAAPPRLAWRPVPVALAEAVRSCPGPLYNNYNDGAALIWWVPDVKVFVDNRQDPYPADVIDAAGDLGRTDYPKVFDKYDVECAYLPLGSPLEDALNRDGWRTVYESDRSVVLVDGSAPRATSESE